MLISAMHITAGVFINDDERGILDDIDEMLNVWPLGIDYRTIGPEDNGAHLKNILAGIRLLFQLPRSGYLGPYSAYSTRNSTDKGASG